MADTNFFIKHKIILVIIIVVSLLIMIPLYFFYNPSTHNIFPECLFFKATKLHCPGCGSQRAIHKLLNGEIIEGIKHNLLILFLFAVLMYQCFIFLYNKYATKKIINLLHKSIVTRIILITIILFWILRNINSYPFTILAP